MTRPKLSAAIITFNEEHNIRACLESVAWFDEIIVVDSGSTDRTVALCKDYTDRIVERPWPGHVLQKQFALDQATGDWILSLDADERLSGAAAADIRTHVIDKNPEADGFIFPRLSCYLGRWIRHGGWFPDCKLRLVRRGCARWGGKDPHDKLELSGTARKLQGEILHYVYRDISHQLATIDSFSGITAAQWLRSNKRLSLFELVFRPPVRFLEMYAWKRGFLDGMPGLIIAVLSSYYVFLKYAKLWELHNKNKD